MKRALPLLAFALACVALAGCDEGLLVDNTDPNATTDPSLGGLLPSAIYTTTDQAIFPAAATTAYYTQSLASPSGSSTDQHYEARLGDAWSGVYDAISDVEALRAEARRQDAPYYAGIAQIIKAFNLGLATDLWGAIPSEEAVGGSANLTPAYDEQEVVYGDVQSLLDSAITALRADTSARIPGSDDIIYGGDLERWRRAAWALKARYLNHLSKTSSYDPQAVLGAVDNAMQSNAGDLQMDYANDDDLNPWHLVYLDQEGGILGGILSEQLVKEMDGTLYDVFDPRLEAAITDSANIDGTDEPGYAGVRNGLGIQETYNHIEASGYYAAENAPIHWITYAEVKFIEAEAALRAGDRSRAYDAYLEGIRAHMDNVGVSAGRRDDYLDADEVAVGEDNLTLDLVFKEKNVALFLNPESWVDHRRHDYNYPDFQPPANQNPLFDSSGVSYIRRVLYPLSELERNRQNAPDVSLDGRLWWDDA